MLHIANYMFQMSMIELCRTNDVVMLSLLEYRLNEGEVQYITLDSNMSIMEGSVGVLPRRILVANDQMPKARKILLEVQNA